jgi:hypothetical protein
VYWEGDDGVLPDIADRLAVLAIRFTIIAIPGVVFGPPAAGAHAEDVAELAGEGRRAGKAALEGYLSYRLPGVLHQLGSRPLNTHPLDEVVERLAHHARNMRWKWYGEKWATSASSLSDRSWLMLASM